MFGGQVKAPINSPHLRKSGGSEQGNGVEEGVSHSMESNDLKSAIAPITTAAIMPSPVLLWRFKVLWFSFFLCCRLLLDFHDMLYC
uniref:Uncharacterized protein MANES_13G073300 n=1 Tax=Rhizophora mucronata TaxID=61149 RepID=A0A2P2LUQ8_RHIMU